jgi:uncharacterized damage-inducible protein DinB
MTAKDAIRRSMDISEHLVQQYIGDLADADLLLRPVEGMNHIAWQLGHLISAERMFVEEVKPGSCPPLPEGFAAAHNKEAAASDDPARFRTKAEYQQLWQTQRAATKAVLDALSDADLDAPTPERWKEFLPTKGAMMNMIGDHVLMHVGQFVAVRRRLGKPALF